MSIIAEALKKAQRRNEEQAAPRPPFDLRPKTGVPAAVPVSTPGAPAARAAKVAVAPGAKAPARRAARRWSLRFPLLVGSILLLFAAALLYFNRIYLPSLQRSAVALTPRPEAPALVAPDQDSAAGEQLSAAPAVAPEQGRAEEPARLEPMAVPSPPSPDPIPAEALPAAAGAEPQPEDLAPVPAALQPDPLDWLPAEPTPAPRGRSEITPRGGAQEQLREDIYHFNMAVFHQRRQDYQAALAEYRKVVELSPHNAEVYSNMGVIHNQLGEFDQAVAVLQKALLIDPGYSKAHNNLGLAYYRSGQPEQALRHLQRAVELEPGNLEGYTNLGLVYRKLGRTGEAEAMFERVLKLSPGYAAAHYNLALLLEETGQLSRAIEHYRAFLENGGGSPELNAQVQRRLTALAGENSGAARDR